MKLYLFIIVSILFSSCNFFTRKPADGQSDFLKDHYIGMISQKISQLELVLIRRGVEFDSSYYSLNEANKLERIKRELEGYRFCNRQIVRVDKKSSIIHSDSIYSGSVSLSCFNSNLDWNLHL